MLSIRCLKPDYYRCETGDLSTTRTLGHLHGGISFIGLDCAQHRGPGECRHILTHYKHLLADLGLIWLVDLRQLEEYVTKVEKCDFQVTRTPGGKDETDVWCHLDVRIARNRGDRPVNAAARRFLGLHFSFSNVYQCTATGITGPLAQEDLHHLLCENNVPDSTSGVL